MTGPEDPSFYCRTCKYALNVRSTPGAGLYFEHALAADAGQTGQADHAPDPIPLAELPGAIQLCDLCSSTASFVYTVDEEHVIDHNVVTKRWVSRSDHRDQGPAARARRTQTQRAHTDVFGKRYAACTDCATLIEAADK